MTLAVGLAGALAAGNALRADQGREANRTAPAVGDFGFDLSGMDRAVAPGTDFYLYANGGWDRRTTIPADRANTGTIERLESLSRSRVRAILEERDPKAGPTPPAHRARAAYAAFLDELQIEQARLAPIAPWLAQLRAVETPQAYVAAATIAGRRGVALPLEFVVAPDDARPDRYALTIGQSGLGMPDRDYYLSDAPAMRRTRDAYARYLRVTLEAAGVADAAAQANAVLALETRIAAASWSAADSRDAARTYNPVAIISLDRRASRIEINELIRRLGFATPRAIVRQPSAVTAIVQLINAAPIATLRSMLIVRALHRYAEVLPRSVRDADFAFYGVAIDGVTTPEPRWRRAVAFVLDAVPDEVSRVYVARYFDPRTKKAAETMVARLVAAFDRHIDTLDWMSPATKTRAHRKLAAFRPRIGYPDRWHDYAGLTITPRDAFGNALRAATFAQAREAAKVGRPIDRWEWSATPMTVDAFANYTKIEITFPAAILQPPFFDPKADAAINYGGIGASIAHEMTHHFDDQGSKYDEAGRLATWWSADDRAAFDRRTAALAAQFDAYTPLPSAHVNGTLTLGENIADLGGLTIAYDAYRASLNGMTAPALDGLSGDQRFFLGWAQIWRLKYREADLHRRLLTNPHAPAAQRVWTARNMAGWTTAFGVKPGEALYLRPEQRVHIW